MLKKYVYVKNKKYNLSLFKIWKKLNWENTYTELEEYKWRVLPKFKSLLHFCNFCRGILWIILTFMSIYFSMKYEILTYFSGSIFVFINIIIITLPVLLLELFILYKTPIETEEI